VVGRSFGARMWCSRIRGATKWRGVVNLIVLVGPRATQGPYTANVRWHATNEQQRPKNTE